MSQNDEKTVHLIGGPLDGHAFQAQDEWRKATYPAEADGRPAPGSVNYVYSYTTRDESGWRHAYFVFEETPDGTYSGA